MSLWDFGKKLKERKEAQEDVSRTKAREKSVERSRKAAEAFNKKKKKDKDYTGYEHKVYK